MHVCLENLLNEGHEECWWVLFDLPSRFASSFPSIHGHVSECILYLYLLQNEAFSMTIVHETSRHFFCSSCVDLYYVSISSLYLSPQGILNSKWLVTIISDFILISRHLYLCGISYLHLLISILRFQTHLCALIFHHNNVIRASVGQHLGLGTEERDLYQLELLYIVWTLLLTFLFLNDGHNFLRSSPKNGPIRSYSCVLFDTAEELPKVDRCVC